ncbi:MAG: hypothetical protein EPO39_13755 [Candidatus Manganitrophaceae bacterium]|nr:MAG: hypothetical protein EPO39_13755 [Candidatus Manganitrophaceae bacterium]
MHRIRRTVGLLVILLSWISFARAEESPVANVERYFPDEVGMSWSYRGSVTDQVQRVGAYINHAAVKGTVEKKGTPVKVFTESNQANEGPAESYFVRDKDGISYYGGDPTTPFESQLVPYRVIRFPLTLKKPFSQLDKSISFGKDLDEDGQEEQAVVKAEIIATGFETVSVPAGVFKESLKLEGTMKIYITLSSNGKTLLMTDKTTNWFAPDVGMVKGIERTEFPSVDGSNPTGTIITEELSEFKQDRSSTH